MKIVIAIFFQILIVLPVYAQVQQSTQTSKLVATVSEAFFDQIQKEHFATERAFLADRLASLVSADDWRHIREQVIEETGPTGQYVAHRLTYYQDNELLAAVDFSGQAEEPDTFICGYLLWEFTTPEAIGLLRFEQNIVKVELFRSMPPQDAAQLLTNWRCPTDLIETILDISVQ